MYGKKNENHFSFTLHTLNSLQLFLKEAIRHASRILLNIQRYYWLAKTFLALLFLHPIVLCGLWLVRIFKYAGPFTIYHRIICTIKKPSNDSHNILVFVSSQFTGIIGWKINQDGCGRSISFYSMCLWAGTDTDSRLCRNS